MKETPERHISKYAAPALGICTKIPQEEKSKLLKKIDEGGSFTKKQIQEFFPKAYEMMNALSEGEEITLETSKEYWYKYHNTIAEHELCRVSFTTYRDQNLKIPSYLNLKEGDVIATHLGTIIEKLQ
ncbi:hypothetical protein HN903_02140 [archaeon]|nr:hypothetical protein [archaeon]MBT7128532.1 hypothetical protein [archaeon]